jgi:2-methylcitrate dehydratase PrpD
MSAVTRDLAKLLVNSSIEDLTSNSRHEAKRSLLNWIGCALGGCNSDAVNAALAAVREFAGPPQAAVLGRGIRLDILHAALLNVISSNILDFNDTHAHMVVHPAEPVAAAVLAFAEYRPVTGAELLHAFILGVEVECRLLDPAVADYRFVWTPTTTVGAFGAAAAVGRLLGLDEQQTAWALGIAATQACGLREMGGSMSKSFNPGHAARCGLSAALLAARDFTATETGIEGSRGFIQAFGTPKDPAAVVAGWGQGFQIELNTYKAFPCGAVTHGAIDACLQLHSRYHLHPEQVAAIALEVHPLALAITGRTAPTSELEAKLSVVHTAACAIVYGKVGVKQFKPECIQDAQVVALRDRITVTADDSFGRDEAQAVITLRNGATLQQHVQHALGSVHRPLSDRALETKFRDLAEPVLPSAAVDQLIAMVWSLESLGDAGSISRIAAGRIP